MFTGIVEESGRVVKRAPQAGGARLTLEAPLVSSDAAIGDSIAVNGCCLTIVAIGGSTLEFDLLAETLRLTNIGALVENSPVNLERALAVGGRLGGHFVQGHIDCTGEILALEPVGADHRLEIELPKALSRYVVHKGSIAVNGISLTVAEVHADSFVLWIIPHTMSATNLGTAKPGDRVNLEADMLAKYTERLLARRQPSEPRP